MAIDKGMLDQLLAGRDLQDLFAKDGLLDELKKALSERMLSAELEDHLENEGAVGAINRRNGSSRKTVLTGTSKVTLAVPRDRAGTFDPKLIAKYQRRFPDFDDKIVSMYARGMTVREIRGHLEELYGIDVSPDLISTITDAVLEAVAEWQSRPLDTCYPLVFFDAIRVKIRDEGFVRNKAVYIALGIQPDGTKEVLGIWIEQTEGAKFWLRVMNELKNRGITDILIAVVDGLKGFPEAINAVFPQTIVQTCIVHLIRNSMSFASWKDRKPIAQALRGVYRAETPEAGLAALEAFEEGHWGRKHPAIAQSWRRHWAQVIPFFAFPEGVRRIIYTTNAIEALNSKIRRAVRTRGQPRGRDEQPVAQVVVAATYRRGIAGLLLLDQRATEKLGDSLGGAGVIAGDARRQRVEAATIAASGVGQQDRLQVGELGHCRDSSVGAARLPPPTGQSPVRRADQGRCGRAPAPPSRDVLSLWWGEKSSASAMSRRYEERICLAAATRQS